MTIILNGTTGVTFPDGTTQTDGLATPVPVADGGTGQTTATAAFNALNPMTTTGDIIYEASATTAARLAIGTTGQVLTVASGIPSWATISTTPTTAQVLAATAGLTAGEVGSYVIGIVNTQSGTVSFGGTRAGSQLRPTGWSIYSDAGSIWQYGSNANLTGTWRSLGYDNAGSQGPLVASTLWVRIS